VHDPGRTRHLFLAVFLLVLLPAAPVYSLSNSPNGARIRLDGTWQFAVDSAGVYRATDVKDVARWRVTQVPLSWTIQFEDLRDFQGVAWYRKTFPNVPLQHDETLMLRFGAVDYLAEVWFNGVRVGTHEGGYTPFEFDVGRLLRSGENEILVRVTDPGSDSKAVGDLNYRQIPHGKQSWYVQTSGIWQSVHADVVSRRRVAGVKITPSPDGTVTFSIRLAGMGGSGGARLTARVLDPHVWEVGVVQRTVPSNAEYVTLQVHVRNPMPWSPTVPNLYVAEVTLERGGPVTDRFGFRSFEAKNKQLLLNGEPFYMIGALDQDFFPATGYTPPSEEYLRDEMVKAKRIGLNTLRCHMKVPDPMYLKLADELGLLIWYEIPNWDQFTPEAGKRAEATLQAMLERDWNHPSLVVISLINEGWGLDMKQQYQRSWLKSTFDEARALAKGRLVVDNSACWGNFHLKTDICDYHTYWAFPENRLKFDRAIGEYAKRPSWLFSPFGDAEESGQEPLVLSEFGNWGMPEIPSPPPWWLNRKFGNAEVVLPEGFAKRFAQHGLESVFGNMELFADRSQSAQQAALKYEIEQLRMTPQIGGYVITEFTDVQWECNGLLDMWRKVKSAGRELGQVQQPDVIIPRPVKYNYWADEPIQVHLWFSHYSSVDLEGSTLTWSTSTGEHGITPLGRMDRGAVRELLTIRVPAFPTSISQSMRISFQCITRNGLTAAENSCDVYVYPHPDSSSLVPAILHDPSNRLGAVERLLRLSGPQKGAESKLRITAELDNQIQERLVRGETILCLIDSTTRMPADFPYALVRRDTGWYDGNWASSLNWVRRDHGPFSEVNFGPVLGMETSVMGLPLVISGIAPDDFDDVLAGMFVGWLRLNSAYVVQMKVGEGKLLLCTLPLAAQCGIDPYATSVLAALIRYCAREDLIPGVVWNKKRPKSGL